MAGRGFWVVSAGEVFSGGTVESRRSCSCLLLDVLARGNFGVGQIAGEG